MSCHSTAQYPVQRDQSPDFMKRKIEHGSEEWMIWFRNLRCGEPFSKNSNSTDFSLQLAIGIQNFNHWRQQQGGQFARKIELPREIKRGKDRAMSMLTRPGRIASCGVSTSRSSPWHQAIRFRAWATVAPKPVLAAEPDETASTSVRWAPLLCSQSVANGLENGQLRWTSVERENRENTREKPCVDVRGNRWNASKTDYGAIGWGFESLQA
jgi:hypothetical protein